MKHKLKLLVAATAMAAGLAGQANAAILNSQSGNGELFLVAWSESLQRSYTRDLGIQMNNFLTATNQGSTTGGTLAPVAGSYAFNPSASPAIGAGNVTTAGYSLTFQTDALMTSWLGNGSTLASDVVWMVGAMDGTGTGTNGRRYLTTVRPGVTEGNIETAQSNSLLNNFSTGDVLITAVNQTGTHATGTNGSGTATPADSSAYAPVSFGDRWNGNAAFDATAGVGQSMEFFFMTASSTLATGRARADHYANAFGASLWTLSSDARLTYAAASVVSEVPVPAAVWLFGSGLIGLIGIGRRRNAAA